MADVESYLAEISGLVRPTMQSIIDIMTAEGCQAYVKTIYVGFDIEGRMVAAAYVHAKHVEIALSLDEDHPDSRLQDASHLTWRTLPLCLELSSTDQVDDATLLLSEACERIAQGAHDVHRDNDFFISARHRRRHGQTD